MSKIIPIPPALITEDDLSFGEQKTSLYWMTDNKGKEKKYDNPKKKLDSCKYG